MRARAAGTEDEPGRTAAGGTAVTGIESRVRSLERRVATLSDALLMLAGGLEGRPTSEPGEEPAVKAARQAYDLLLAPDEDEGADSSLPA